MMRTFVLLTIHQNICAENPHIYKNFLETLQRYQQEFLPIQDTYAIITRLFEDYPHLVEEFKTFLPESPPEPSKEGKGFATTGGDETQIDEENVSTPVLDF
jgi:histone deacetylase complex regulatory component SIN3